MKPQEALEIAKKNYWICPDEYKDEYIKEKEDVFGTLQKLIDNYSKLEKALDKVCNIATSLQSGGCFDCPLRKCIKGDNAHYCCEKDWKEWALKESDKQ